MASSVCAWTAERSSETLTGLQRRLTTILWVNKKYINQIDGDEVVNVNEGSVHQSVVS